MQVDLLTGLTIVEKSIARLREFEPPEGYYLAFSGGKDSQVIYHLAQMAGVKFDAHYRVCPDAPELLRFIREEYPEVEWHRDSRGFFLRIEERMMAPTRMARYCCDHKEAGGKGRRIIMGIRWEESAKRSKRLMIETCKRDSSQSFINPIIDWSTEDIWWFIKKYIGKWCSLYDEGFRRLGCVLCPMSSNKVRELNRWPRYGVAWKKALFKAYHARIAAGGEWKKHKSPEEYWQWWLADKPSEDERQECFKTDN